MTTIAPPHVDVLVVGAGLAGLTAAAAAVSADATVTVVHGGFGRFTLGAGCLMSRPPGEETSDADTEAAAFFAAFARAAGCPILGTLSDQRHLPTLLGGVQPIAMAPVTVSTAAEARGRVALVGFTDLPFFDVDFMAERLNRRAAPTTTYVPRWAVLPQDAGPLRSTLHVANRFDRDPAFREALLATLGPVTEGVEALILPGCLGQHTRADEIERFAQALGCPLGELPTLPPSVPGLRLFHALRDYLVHRGVEIRSGFPVTALVREGRRCRGVLIEAPGRPQRLTAGSVILASGRHSLDLLGGTPAHVDDCLRPCDAAGSCLLEGLYVAGSILTGDDRRRDNERAILTGYRAGALATGGEVSHAA